MKFVCMRHSLVALASILVLSATQAWADADNDGMPDAWEESHGLNPALNDAADDPDNDMLSNLQEYILNTDPMDNDTDDDGLSDGVESRTGIWTSESDTGTDPLVPDTDGDTLLDGVETCTGIYLDSSRTGTDPNNANSDGDGKDDGEETAIVARDPNVADDPAPNTVYSQKFDRYVNGTTDLRDGSRIVGGAFVFDGVLQLTTNNNSQNVAFHIPARVGSSEGFTAKFEYTIMDNTGNPPADGFSFSYGSLPFGGTSSVAEEGFPGVSPCLSFEMDTWKNGSSEVGPAIGMDRPGASEGTVAHINGDILDDGTAAAPSMIRGTISITVLHNGAASFTSTGAKTNADFHNIITSFEMRDDHSFAITARTGGANQEVTIDNIEVRAGLPDTDRDGMSDLYEEAYGLDPTSDLGDDGADGDPDGDGLRNLDEHDAGTNPTSEDTDGDGLSDDVEDGKGTYVNASRTGTSPINADTDGDGLPDGLENPDLPFIDITQPGTDPNSANTDGDLESDASEIALSPLIGRDPTIADDPPFSNRYQQNFDAYPDGFTNLGDRTTIAATAPDTASVQDGALRLSLDGVDSLRSSFRMPALLGSSQGFIATFDFTITDSAGGNEPADGFNFSYGAIPPYDPRAGSTSPAGHGTAEESWPGVDHLSFEIDTWRNGTAEVGVNIAGEIGGVPTEYAFTNGDILADGTTVSGAATISWNPSAGASFTTTGLLTNANFQDVAVPGFVGDDAFIFAIGHRTGGANETLTIDNLVVTTSSQPLRFDITSVGDDLRLAWDSKAGRVYDIVISPDLSTPITAWDVVLADLPSSAPENLQLIPRPAEARLFYAVIERPAPAFYEEDFESGQNGWTNGVSDTFNNTAWILGTPLGDITGPTTGADGSQNCFATNLGSYGSQSDIWLRSPVLDLSTGGITGAVLEMQHFRDGDGSGDIGTIQILRAGDLAPLGPVITPDFTRFDDDWVPFSAALPAEAIGELIQLEFRFVSDATEEFSGWSIDNIKISLE